MSRPLGGYIGYDGEPTTDAAPGIWTLREAEFYQRKAQWPVPFAPDVITGLQLWLDASDASTLYDATTGGSLVAADGGVARWEDKSGNNYHMTQATAGSRPARKTAIQGGLDVLRLDGSDDFMSIASSTATFKFLHSTQATVFIAAKYGTTANPDALFSLLASGEGATTEVGFVYFFDDRSGVASNRMRVLCTNGVSGQVVVNSGTDNNITPNEFAVTSLVIDNSEAVAAQRIAYRLNGGSAQTDNASSNTASSANAAGDLHVGRLSTAATGYLDGDICEIIIYNSALSDTDREAVENYLLAKWGIS